MKPERQDYTIVIQQYDSPVEANIMRTKLEANDIPCFLSDENIVGLNPLYSVAVGGAKLHVFEKDKERALQILKETCNEEELEQEEPEHGKNLEMQCPECHSFNVSYGPATQRRFSLLMVLLSLLLAVYPFQSRKAWHCFDCGHEFK